MPVDRITVTFPADLGRQLRELASARDVTVSSLVGTAVERLLRQHALNEALGAAKRRMGPIDLTIEADVSAAFDAAERVPASVSRRRNGRGR